MSHSLYARFHKALDRLFENELFRRVVKNSGYLFSTTGISAAFSMLQGILAARLLGVEAFGVLGAITTFTSFLNKFVSFRMGELVVKYVGHYSETGDDMRAAAIFKLAALVEMLASLVAFGLVLLLAPIGARFLAKDASTTNLFAIYGTIVLANLIAESSMGLLQIYDRFRNVAFLQLLQSAVTLVLIAVAFFMHGGLIHILLAYVAGKMIGAVGLTISAFVEAASKWGKTWWRAPLGLLRHQTRDLASFAISTNISASLSLVTKDSEVLWVSLFRNPVETGYYKLALALANMVQMPVSPLPQATYPEISRQVARNKWANVRYILRQGSRLAGGYTLLASVVLVAFGRPLISWLYKPEFLPAYPALVILLIGFLAANTFYWRRLVLLALDRADFPAKLNTILATLKIIGILLFVPRHGYLASAALLSGFYIFGSIVSVWKIRLLLARYE
jgi:O-antigen/teichoic acid export membrane protein